MPLAFTHIFEPGQMADAPPLLLLHGTGGNEHDLLPLGRALSPGAPLLSPRGLVNEQGSARFFARLGHGVFDPNEVTQRTHELADFLSGAAKKYSIDLNRLIAVGLSNGANIAATLLLLRPVVLGGAVLFRPMVVLDSSADPRSLEGKRVLICSGNRDSLVPPDHPRRLASHLRAGGAQVTLHEEPVGHGIAQGDITAAQSWVTALTPAAR